MIYEWENDKASYTLIENNQLIQLFIENKSNGCVSKEEFNLSDPTTPLLFLGIYSLVRENKRLTQNFLDE